MVDVFKQVLDIAPLFVVLGVSQMGRPIFQLLLLLNSQGPPRVVIVHHFLDDQERPLKIAS